MFAHVVYEVEKNLLNIKSYSVDSSDCNMHTGQVIELPTNQAVTVELVSLQWLFVTHSVLRHLKQF